MPELLEHVADWRQCLGEAARVLDSEGLLLLSTTNRLCPKQQEFALPLYSWYPRSVKERCLARARTDRRHWVGYAEFPAIHWFDPYQLAVELRRLGMKPFDRFELWREISPSAVRRIIGRIVSALPPARFIGHVLTPSTLVIGRKLRY
jgi:2-polyprenyl-6-hydroxyphenyl methylase/3-demethylubiquinone-9 3-methyltransferase